MAILPRTLLLVSVIALAGCTNPFGVGATAKIEFTGTGGGTHSETGNCDDSGKVNGNGKVTDGEVLFRVTDAQGNEKFERSFNADFSLDDQSLSGISGSWKLEATRSGNDLLGGDPFNGDYHFALFC